jgi:hypothetical protein
VEDKKADSAWAIQGSIYERQDKNLPDHEFSSLRSVESGVLCSAYGFCPPGASMRYFNRASAVAVEENLE